MSRFRRIRRQVADAGLASLEKFADAADRLADQPWVQNLASANRTVDPKKIYPLIMYGNPYDDPYDKINEDLNYDIDETFDDRDDPRYD